MGLIQPLTMMFWSFVVMFIYCDFGERISCGFEAVHNGIEECDWYLFPIEMQKMLLIIMAADEPIVLKGFANVVMTRETFKKVVFFVIFPKEWLKIIFFSYQFNFRSPMGDTRTLRSFINLWNKSFHQILNSHLIEIRYYLFIIVSS